MAEQEGCKHTLELSVPLEQVEAETERVIAQIRKRVKLPGFRPGKVPESLIRGRFASDIRKDVIEALVPRTFKQHAERENLRVVGQPGVTDVHLQQGEPLRFTIEYETFPDIEIGEYRGLTVEYREPQVGDADIAARLEVLRNDKAEYVNLDPRPVAGGDHAVVALRSISGVDGPPVEQDELVLHIGDEDTLPAFSENLLGMTPGEEKQIEVVYPENYGAEKLAGKTVVFHVRLRGIRKKELPDLDDDFASEVGDFKTLEELKEQVRIELLRASELLATQDAKNKLVEQLVDAHEFPVPEAFIDRQIESNLEARLRELAAQGVDPHKIQVDWHELKKSQHGRALREVKASLLLDKIADREAIETLTEEVDREVHRLAKQLREPAAAVRMRLEKEGALGRIVSRIRTDKVLNLLFETARKVAPEGGS